jgi:hypothetical protein
VAGWKAADRKEKRAASAHTFEVVARQRLKLLEPRVTKGQLTADTFKDTTRILGRDIFPALGTRPIADINARSASGKIRVAASLFGGSSD